MGITDIEAKAGHRQTDGARACAASIWQSLWWPCAANPCQRPNGSSRLLQTISARWEPDRPAASACPRPSKSECHAPRSRAVSPLPRHQGAPANSSPPRLPAPFALDPQSYFDFLYSPAALTHRDAALVLMLIFSHFQFAQGPSDASGSVPGNSPCVKTSGLGGGLNTLNTRGTSGSCSRCSPSQAPKPIRTPPRFRLRRASSCLANKNACILDAWTSALGRCRSGHGQAEPSDVLTKSHPSARASFMLP